MNIQDDFMVNEQNELNELEYYCLEALSDFTFDNDSVGEFINSIDLNSDN
ncbi:hypothetical protein PN836_010935 [Ningiella sp. W23]